jgi:hypothetical protein
MAWPLPPLDLDLPELPRLDPPPLDFDIVRLKDVDKYLKRVGKIGFK